MNVEGDAAIGRAARAQPVVYMAFDLLHLDGRSLLELPYERRRALLDGLRLEGPAWRTPRSRRGGGQALLDATREQGLEGIVAKRLDARYEPGRRSGAWRKLRNRRRQELVVGGWTEGEGKRAGHVGALLLGAYEGPGGPLRYVGRVGSGFSDAVLEDLQRRLEPLGRTRSPFRPDPERPNARPPRGARWVAPQLVAEVELSDVDARRARAPERLQGAARRQACRGGRAGARRCADRRRGGPHPRARPARSRARRPRAAHHQPRQAAVPADRLHEGRPDRLLRGDRADAAAAPARPAADAAPLAGRRRGEILLREALAEPSARLGRDRLRSTAAANGGGSSTASRRSAATLAWLGNQAAIELHPALHRAPRPRASDGGRLRPRPRSTGRAAGVRRGCARAARPVRADRPRQRRQDVGRQGAAGLRAARRARRDVQARRSRSHSGSRCCWSSSCPSSSSRA